MELKLDDIDFDRATEQFRIYPLPAEWQTDAPFYDSYQGSPGPPE